MSDIYIIFYTDQSCIDGDRSWVEEIYFTDKNKAIKHLEDNGYEHEQDDIYTSSCGLTLKSCYLKGKVINRQF